MVEAEDTIKAYIMLGSYVDLHAMDISSVAPASKCKWGVGSHY